MKCHILAWAAAVIIALPCYAMHFGPVEMFVLLFSIGQVGLEADVPFSSSIRQTDPPPKIDWVGGLAFRGGSCESFCKDWRRTWRCHMRMPWPVNCAGQRRDYLEA